LVDPQDLLEHFEESGLIERIKKFVQVHRNSFLLLNSPFNGKRELEILSMIQHRYVWKGLSWTDINVAMVTSQYIICTPPPPPLRFFGSNLRILPVRNNTELVKGMLTIAKVKETGGAP